MNVLSLIADITEGKPAEIRPDPPRIRPDETHVKQGNSPHSPHSPPDGVELQKQAPPAPAPRPPEALPGDDWYDSMICMVLDDLNDAGIEVMDYPEEVRRTARQFFDEFSEAAAGGDMGRFWTALRAWRETWLKSLH